MKKLSRQKEKKEGSRRVFGRICCLHTCCIHELEESLHIEWSTEQLDLYMAKRKKERKFIYPNENVMGYSSIWLSTVLDLHSFSWPP